MQSNVGYRRILPVQSLTEVENPWRGVTLNRCLLVAIAIIAVSSGLERVQETLGPYFEEGEVDLNLNSELLPEGASAEEGGSWWDSLAFWSWGGDDDDDDADDEEEHVMKRKPRTQLPRDSVGLGKIRNKDIPSRGLLKERTEG